MMSAACLAYSVPAIPIANPTFAFFKAGASFVPSPVTATIWPICLSPVTIVYLSSGDDLASTSNSSIILLNSSMFPTTSFLAFFPCLGQAQSLVSHFSQTVPPTMELKVGPSMTRVKSVVIPICFAMASAVFALSPVTILTLIPAVLHSFIESETFSRGGS